MARRKTLSNLDNAGYGTYRGTAEWALGPELYELISTTAHKAVVMAKETMARSTGKLARSVNAETFPYAGGTLTAWQAYVETNAGHSWDPGHSYGAAHEFGWFDSRTGKQHPGGHELFEVLKAL